LLPSNVVVVVVVSKKDPKFDAQIASGFSIFEFLSRVFRRGRRKKQKRQTMIDALLTDLDSGRASFLKKYEKRFRPFLYIPDDEEENDTNDDDGGGGSCRSAVVPLLSVDEKKKQKSSSRNAVAATCAVAADAGGGSIIVCPGGASLRRVVRVSIAVVADNKQ